MTKQTQQPNSIKMPGANAIAASALQNGKIVKQMVTTTLQTEDRPPDPSKPKERYWLLRDDLHRTFLDEIFHKIDPPTLGRIHGGGSYIICPIDEFGNEIRDKEQKINIGGTEMNNGRFGGNYGNIPQIVQPDNNNRNPTTVIMPNNLPPSPPPSGGMADFLQMAAANKAIEDERRRTEADERKIESEKRRLEREENDRRDKAAEDKRRIDEQAREDKKKTDELERLERIKTDEAAREKKKEEEKEARAQKIEDEERAHKRKLELAKAELEEKLALAKLENEKKDADKKAEQDRKDLEWKREQATKEADRKSDQERRDSEWRRDQAQKELDEKKERAKQEEIRADRDKKEREEKAERDQKAQERESRERKEYREEQIRRDAEARKDAIALAQNKTESMKVLVTLATSLVPKVLESLKPDPPMLQPPPFVPTQQDNSPLLMSAIERISENVSRNRRDRDDEDDEDDDNDRRGGRGSGGGMEEAMSVLRMGIDLGRGNAPVAAEKKDEGLIDKLLSAAPMLTQVLAGLKGGMPQQQQVQQRPQQVQHVQRKPVQRIEHQQQQTQQVQQQQIQQNNQQEQTFTKGQVEEIFEGTLDQVFSDADFLKSQILKNPKKYGPAIMKLIQEDASTLLAAMNSTEEQVPGIESVPEEEQSIEEQEAGLDAFNASETAEG